MIERADRVLVWLSMVTLIFGGGVGLAVVFMAGPLTDAMAAAPMPIQVEAAPQMPKVAELHHWLAYKAATVQNDFEANYHVEKALDLVTDAEHRSLLDGLLREHLPAGHFIHTEGTLEELLGASLEPHESLDLLHANLAQLLLDEGNIGEAQEQVEHLVVLATGPEKEQGQRILDALTAGDTETASSLLAELSG